MCTCQDAGEIECDMDMQCPALIYQDNEIEAKMDDICCPYCSGDWVEVRSDLKHLFLLTKVYHFLRNSYNGSE